MVNLNNIYLGDCLNVMQNMSDNSVDCLLTDIPYDGVNRETNGLRNLDKGKADILEFDIVNYLEHLFRIVKGSFYLFCGFGQISPIHNFFKEKGLNTRLIIWEKSNPSPMNGETTWLSGVEPCVFCKKPNATFNLHCANTVIKEKIAEPTGHPTPKPINLMRKLVLASSNENDIIFDPFMGGGTTCVAAIKEKRRYIGVEKDEQFFEIAKKRIEQELSQPTLF